MTFESLAGNRIQNLSTHNFKLDRPLVWYLANPDYVPRWGCQKPWQCTVNFFGLILRMFTNTTMRQLGCCKVGRINSQATFPSQKVNSWLTQIKGIDSWGFWKALTLKLSLDEPLCVMGYKLERPWMTDPAGFLGIFLENTRNQLWERLSAISPI